MKKRRIIIVGAGGFAREVAWLIRDINHVRLDFEFAGYVVSDLTKLSNTDSRGEVRGDFDWLEKNRDSWDSLALGIGTPPVRRKVSNELDARFSSIDWPVLIHPTVLFDRGSCEIARGALLCANTVGTVNLKIGAFALVNLACTLGHEAVIGPWSVLNPTVNISGGAEIGEAALIGTGAQVLQYCKVGAEAKVGAGAVVTRDVQCGETVVGIPAKAHGRAK